MRTRLIVSAMLAAIVATGCARVSNSALNPFNWFGRSAEVAVTQTGAIVDGRPLVAQVVALTVDPTNSGAVISAAGLPPVQGYWDAELVPDPTAAAGVLAFTFRTLPPPVASRVSTPASRQVTAGYVLSNADLAGIREIRVNGATNARAVRR
jgi:hypothetical protein